MKLQLCSLILCAALARAAAQGAAPSTVQAVDGVFTDGPLRASITAEEAAGLRTYTLTSNAELRDHRPPEKRVTFAETADHARLRTGNLLFDGLYALAVAEAGQNSVAQIKDNAYGHGEPVTLKAFQTGEFWTYVWTRDLSYSVALGLGQFDPERAASSLLFKTSPLKPSVTGGLGSQIVQDTGSGGSYPVSSDRIVWALGADATLRFLPEADQPAFLAQIYPILRDTLEHDRRVLFDPVDGLYRGEQSFLDWREQTYPAWTKDHVVALAMSKSLSMNAANYFALRTTAEYAGLLHRPEEQARYTAWAAALKTAINRKFYDPEAGLYSTYLLTDPADGIRVRRYDLLGESLAILLGVASAQQAQTILSQYPTGPYGPPVVWPQERSVPIYHNQAIWPFVTAFWTKAARQAGHVAAVDAGVRSLVRGAALNLSHMENFDFVTGAAHVKTGDLTGPVINSRRQLWSVAGYLGVVQDVVFGLETSRDGLRFAPFVTGQMRTELFGSSTNLELQNFSYRGKTLHVRLHLPADKSASPGACGISKVELNGKWIGRGMVPAASLAKENQWDIYLENPSAEAEVSRLKLVDVTDPAARFGPPPPEWEDVGQGGLTAEEGRVVLHFRAPTNAEVAINIYRDGLRCAEGLTTNLWADPQSTDFDRVLRHYTLEAVDLRTGNASHLTSARGFATTTNQLTIPATAMDNLGGTLVDGHHFMNWGKPGDELRINRFTVRQSGHYLLRVEFANGSGPVNTGITCGVKRLELYRTGSGQPVASGYLVMPQSGDWKRFDWSSVIRADLRAGERYSLRLFEDGFARNMSYLAGNERYTAWPGGGPEAYNFVNVSALQFQRVAR